MPSKCCINMARHDCNNVFLTNVVLTVCCTMEVVCLQNAVFTKLDIIVIVFLNKYYTDSVLYYVSVMPSKCCINMVRHDCKIVFLTNVVLTVCCLWKWYAFQMLY